MRQHIMKFNGDSTHIIYNFYKRRYRTLQSPIKGRKKRKQNEMSGEDWRDCIMVSSFILGPYFNYSS